ncbi:diphthamide biosynthesis protein [Astrocystis sublimbata]|nr:diphthamide biosynthesis protein [Astrocystis sublimbata]
MAEEEEEIAVYDEVEIEDMTFDETLQIYHYPCPCGDRFEIALLDLQDESTDIAVCPSCSLMIRVIFDQDNLPQPPPEDPPQDPAEQRQQQQHQVSVAA